MSDPFTHVHPTYMEINNWLKIDPTIIAGFTTRLYGTSKDQFNALNMGLHVHDNPTDVVKNRDLLARVIGLPLSDWVCGEQIHDTAIYKVTSEHKGSGSTNMETALTGKDGIYTKEKGILLTAFFADCVPTSNKKKKEIYVTSLLFAFCFLRALNLGIRSSKVRTFPFSIFFPPSKKRLKNGIKYAVLSSVL